MHRQAMAAAAGSVILAVSAVKAAQLELAAPMAATAVLAALPWAARAVSAAALSAARPALSLWRMARALRFPPLVLPVAASMSLQPLALVTLETAVLVERQAPAVKVAQEDSPLSETSAVIRATAAMQSVEPVEPAELAPVAASAQSQFLTRLTCPSLRLA
jgi:hypothetical protein